MSNLRENASARPVRQTKRGREVTDLEHYDATLLPAIAGVPRGTSARRGARRAVTAAVAGSALTNPRIIHTSVSVKSLPTTLSTR